MEAKDWLDVIVTRTKAVGTYKEEFDSIIQTLAEILEERDRVKAEYVKAGSMPYVVYISDRGSENIRENPILKQWLDLNDRCLVYWREIGLTPAGLKKITEEMGGTESNPLESILSGLEKGHARKKVQADSGKVRAGRGSRKDNSGKQPARVSKVSGRSGKKGS